MDKLSLSLFGDVSLVRGLQSGLDGVLILPRKTQMLLAYVASDRGNGVSREKLAHLIWPDRGEEQARHSLRQCLFTLCKAIGDGHEAYVLADRHTVAMNGDLMITDTAQFEALLAEDTPDALRAAARLYGGEFLSGLNFEHEALETWCVGERTRFRELCYEALAKLVSHCADTAQLEEAIEMCRRLVDLDPLREDAHRTLMRLFDRAGRRADGLRQYAICRDILRADLSIDPEAATTKLYHEIKAHKEAVPGETILEETASAAIDVSGQAAETGAPETDVRNAKQPPALGGWQLAALGAGLAVAVVFLSAWVWTAIQQQV